MDETAQPPPSDAAQDGNVVALLVPEAVAQVFDPVALGAALAASSKKLRILLCLTEPAGLPLATALDDAGVKTEILLGPALDAPVTKAFVLRAPPGTSATAQMEFGLALADVVLVASSSDDTPLSRAAAKFGKPAFVPGTPLPAIPSAASVTHRLDPKLPGWHSWGRCVFGRLEQTILELLAFNWLGRAAHGAAESRKQLRKCWRRSWRPGAYFAPEPEWRNVAPDRTAVDPSSKIVACFDALDRSALYGSYVHRDLVWIEHFGAAFAVLAAVAGQLIHSHLGWGIVELVTLAVVALLVIVARRTSLQERWTACRLGAEQLRIARMSLPLLVVPPALATSDKPPDTDGHSSQETEFGFQALAQVKRIVRDHGLPRLDPGFTAAQASGWLRLIVDDQIKYHHRNHRKLEHAERRLRFLTQMIFLAAAVAVVVQFCVPAEWLLLFTAAGPALAAALHGTGTRLGIVHRKALSIDAERDLVPVTKALAGLSRASLTTEAAWRNVRRLASEAAAAMGRENTSWHRLVRRYRDDLP